MNYLEQKAPPIREERLQACHAFGGTASCLESKSKIGCLHKTKRSFAQSGGCQFTLALSTLYTFSDAVIILHGPLGCGTAYAMPAYGVVKSLQGLRGLKQSGLTTVSTNLGEADVISGGEKKLRDAIIDIDARLRPSVIVVASSCVPALIGDDVEAVVRDARTTVAARIVTLHCEGFKTKIQATAYDAVYHGVLKALFDIENPDRPIPVAAKTPETERRDAEYELRRKRTVNLLNVSSMSWADETELTRLLGALGLEANVFPCFSHPDDFVRAQDAALSVSICPTHDDYFLKHLEELYGVPSCAGTMPLGLSNTRAWLLDVAKRFNLGTEAERLIEREESEARAALAELRERLKGKTAFVCAGEFRAAATAHLLEEDYGMKVLGVKAFHYDSFADEIYASLPRKDEIEINVATWQPFEQSNALRKLKPDVFIGHPGTTAWAAREGFAVLPVFGLGFSYMGYRGAWEFATRIVRVLENQNYNKAIAPHVRSPYRDSWYADDPFKYIKES